MNWKDKYEKCNEAYADHGRICGNYYSTRAEEKRECYSQIPSINKQVFRVRDSPSIKAQPA